MLDNLVVLFVVLFDGLLFPVDDIDASSYSGHALALQVVNQLVVGSPQRLQFRDVGNHFLEDSKGFLGQRL